MRDYGYEAQKAAEAHLARIDAWQDYYEREDFGEEATRPDFDDPAVAPYDGCRTCDVREILAAAWPVMVEAARNGAPFITEAGEQ